MIYCTGPHICKWVSHYLSKIQTPIKWKPFMPCLHNTFLYNMWVFVYVWVRQREKQGQETGMLMLRPSLVLAQTPGICFSWLIINAPRMLCSAGNLYKDTVESLFVKVYYKGRLEGVCHNEVVFKPFTKYRGDTSKKCPLEACTQSKRE